MKDERGILKPGAHMAIFSLATFAEQPVKSHISCRGKEVGENWGIPEQLGNLKKLIAQEFMASSMFLSYPKLYRRCTE